MRFSLLLPFLVFACCFVARANESKSALDLINECEITLGAMHEKNAYIISRDAIGQSSRGTYLLSAVKALSENEIWFDIGSGLAKPQQEILQEYQQHKIDHLPLMIALGISKPKAGQGQPAATDLDIQQLNQNLKHYKKHFKYIENTFEEFDLKLLKGKKVSLYTSYFGGAAYTLQLSEFMQKVFDSLKLNGEFDAFGINSHTFIYNIHGETVPMNLWIENNIPGIEIISSSFNYLICKKKLENIKIPKLYLFRATAAGPPLRYFTEINPATAADGTLIAKIYNDKYIVKNRTIIKVSSQD